MKGLLEVCVDSVESAISASEGKADRLELCSGLVIGGITPTISMFDKIKDVCDTPINVLIRPRFADFLYDDYEKDIILSEIKMFAKAGANGVVIGALQKDGQLDIEFLKRCMDYAKGIDVTLHRAFDVCSDPFKAMDEAIELGIDTILTSGQESNCMKGKELIKQLVEKSGKKIDILVGSGVDETNIKQLHEETKAKFFHMSGKVIKQSQMQFRKQNVPMGIDSLSEFEIYCTDKQKIKKAKEIILNF